MVFKRGPFFTHCTSQGLAYTCLLKRPSAPKHLAHAGPAGLWLRSVSSGVKEKPNAPLGVHAHQENTHLCPHRSGF